MDTATLVDKKIADGKILLEELKTRKWAIVAAFWNQDWRSHEWKLYLADKRVVRVGKRNLYLRLSRILKAIKPELSIHLDDIVFIEHNLDLVHIIMRKMVDRESDTSDAVNSIHITGNPDFSSQLLYYQILAPNHHSVKP